MVERVARALAHSAGAAMSGPGQSVATRAYGWEGDGGHLDRYVEEHWANHVHAAKFAIAALREPTSSVVDAGERTFISPDYASAREAFNAMIDEALK